MTNRLQKKLNGNRDTINKRHIVDSRVENPKQTRCHYKAYSFQEYLPHPSTRKQKNITSNSTTSSHQIMAHISLPKAKQAGGRETRCDYKAYYLQEYLPQPQCMRKQNNITSNSTTSSQIMAHISSPKAKQAGGRECLSNTLK